MADGRPQLRQKTPTTPPPDQLRPARTTHSLVLLDAIDVVAPDGRQRVPFSVVLDDSNDLIVFSFAADGGSIMDRFGIDGRHRGIVAAFADGDDAGCLRAPSGVANDGAGNLYIPDAGRHCIVKIAPTGDLIAEFGGEGTAEGELRGPRDIEVASDGTMLVADTENHRIQLWAPDGSLRACFGAEEDEDEESAYLQGGHGDGEFLRPYGVTFDAEGRMWVADTNNHRIQRLSEHSGFDLTFGAHGEAAGALSFPIDIRIDAEGGAVVADLGGRRLQWFHPDGKLDRAIAPADAIPEGASIADVDVDDDGVVYIPVGPHSRIYRVRAGEPT